MNKNIIKEIIYILIALVVGIITVKFIFYAIPVIVVAIISYLIYRTIKKNKVNRGVNKNSKRPIKIIHDIDDED